MQISACKHSFSCEPSHFLASLTFYFFFFFFFPGHGKYPSPSVWVHGFNVVLIHLFDPDVNTFVSECATLFKADANQHLGIALPMPYPPLRALIPLLSTKLAISNNTTSLPFVTGHHPRRSSGSSVHSGWMTIFIISSPTLSYSQAT